MGSEQTGAEIGMARISRVSGQLRHDRQSVRWTARAAAVCGLGAVATGAVTTAMALTSARANAGSSPLVTSATTVVPSTAGPAPALLTSFTYQGGQTSYTYGVPSNVDSVRVTVDGAAGSGGIGPGPSSGGLGGEVTATVAVTPGETLIAVPGGPGANTGVGGYGGGGAGAQEPGSTAGGGGGGGGSFLYGRVGGAAPVLLVAAGGGGGGTSASAGGAGGGPNGQAGSAASGVTPGTGANASGPGSTGGTGPTDAVSPGNGGTSSGYGGGGGGGYFGGGAGSGGGGGGGGSGWWILGSSGLKVGTNFASAGQISISPAPSVIAVAPSKGPLAGGQSVVITGADFEKGDTVRFGTRAATMRSIAASGQSMTVDAPPGSPGSPVDVTVTAPWGGASMISSGDQYSYLAVPTVTSIVPTHGSTDGGTPLQIQGTGLTPDSTVTVGGKPTPVVNAGGDGTWLQVVTPTGLAGPAPIVVSNPGGTSTAGPASTFSYDGPAASTTTTTTDPATTTTRPNPTTTAPPASSTTSSTLWVPPVPPPDPSTSTTTAPGWIGSTSSGLGTSAGGSTFYDPSSSYGGYGYTNAVGPGLSFTGGSTTETTLGSDPQVVPADASSPTTAATQGIQPAAIIGTSGHSLLTTILAIVALGELLVMLFLWKLGKNLALTRNSGSQPDGQGE